MKIVAFAVASVMVLSMADAVKYGVLETYTAAQVTLSGNVKWDAPVGGEALVDGILTETATDVSYTSNSCEVPQKDLGYVTLDLGFVQLVDAIRIFMPQGKSYCNLFVNVWGEFGEAPRLPIDEFAPTEAPSKAPTPAPTPAPISKAPTPAPTKAKPAEPKGTLCEVCDGGICGLIPGNDPKVHCPGDKPYCMNHMVNDKSGRRTITKECASAPTCETKWWEQTSDISACTDFNPLQSYQFPFQCYYCCVKDGCNKDIYPETSTLYEGHTRRHLLNQDTNVYASTNHDFGPTFTADGMTIPLAQPQMVRYIRVWAGKSSTDNQASILEIQPLYQEDFAPTDTFAFNDETPTFSDELPTEQGFNFTVTVDPLTGSSSGDPHFKTWSGEKYDFHGGCDLVLVQNSGFMNGLGLNIHIRTKINTWWSYIDSAVVQIGRNTLEVSGGEDGGSYWVNGQAGEELKDGDNISLSPFKATFRQVNHKQKRFRIDFGEGDVMSIETYKSFVRVNVRAKNAKNFKGTVGLMGSYPSGAMMARDGHTLLSNPNEFGVEWQVLASEPMLFHALGEVQPPMQCAMPDKTTKKSRRLGESLISEEDAALACARVNLEDRDACIFDVLATNDKDMAGAY